MVVSSQNLNADTAVLSLNGFVGILLYLVYYRGTTHFCEPCHKRQCAGDYVSKYTKDKLPKCTGKATCPIKCDHKPNGDECSLGCSICRNIKDNAREF